jgi:hypothetical protein
MSQRTYLIFGDIEGKLDVLRVECTKCARKGRYSVRKLIEQGKHDEMEGATKRRLPEAGCTRPARALRFDMSRFAEDAVNARHSPRGRSMARPMTPVAPSHLHHKGPIKGGRHS